MPAREPTAREAGNTDRSAKNRPIRSLKKQGFSFAEHPRKMCVINVIAMLEGGPEKF
jgi:hypothetical protein